MDYEIRFVEKDAIEMAEKDDKVLAAKNENGLVLASLFTMITDEGAVVDRWNVNYLNPSTDELTDYLVTCDGVELINTSKRVHTTAVRSLDVSKAMVSITEILSAAKKKCETDFPYEVQKVFLTLHNNADYENECWTITFFSKNLYLYKLKIDAVSGKIVTSGLKHLLK